MITQRIYSRGTPYARAMNHVQKHTSGCWIWIGARTSGGYGHINLCNGSHRNAHIVIYEHERGPVPNGLELDHLCRVKECVNPDHLEAVTHRENCRRGDGAKRKCDHAESEVYRYPRGPRKGRIANCRACRRERRK